ncbi:hypothetical protein HY095_03970 [Candidatus Micrarchaeota archaeon]|nr:hypothetical protein [Candidatus Micrarchaeota archaeon]
MDSRKVTEAAYKHALKNAFEYGSANPSAVVGKVIAEAPEAKTDMRTAMQIIRQQVEIANKLPKEVLARELHKFEFAQKKEEPHKLRLHDAVEGTVVTRFPPEPNGFLHIGHAKAAWLNRKAADDWNGKCLLRFDDTNPEAEDPQFLSVIKADLQWLGVNFHGESYASDLMEMLYGYGRELILCAGAYACDCTQERIRENREKMAECACRNRSADENLKTFEGMVEGKAKEGQSIIRFKGDMKSLNTVMRDPAMFRIIDAPHYRQGSKFKAWPSYDFEVCIADSVTGVTHALRSKEYELRDELYYAILDRLALRKPVVYEGDGLGRPAPAHNCGVAPQGNPSRSD